MPEDRLSLLLLDDNAALVELYRQQLEAVGPFLVTRETDGRRARRLADAQLFDLVVIDAKLAYRGVEFGGLRLADDLRSRYGNSSLLVISRFITVDLVRDRDLDYAFMEKHDDAGGQRFTAALCERLLEMRRAQFAFVAMPFRARHEHLYNSAIVPAVHDAGLKCVRVDKVTHNRGIQNVIFDLVNQSKLVIFVADDANPNAYYEAGFADAMRKEVIIVTRSLEALRFDISNRHAVTYGKGESGLRENLARKIAGLRLERPPGL